MKYTIFWFRRDLRIHDNAGLYHALKAHHNVLPLFIFDKNILDKLANKSDARVTFIHDTIQALKAELNALGTDLLVKYGDPITIWEDLLKEHDLEAVYTNHDFETYAQQRDETVRNLLTKKNIPFNTYKDHVIFEKNEVVKDDGLPYTVFTPYSKKWMTKLASKISTWQNPNGEIKEISFFILKIQLK